LNQYTVVDDFTPQLDDDGNQTLVKTATGVWQISYNGENRPIHWANGDMVITMSYDRMGRRVTKNAQRFVYDGFLQIANFEQSVTNSQLTTQNLQLFIWDPTEPVATRPLVWLRGDSVAHYCHDGNKNVSEVVAENGDIAAHYGYAPFGAVTVQRGASASDNPWRFSSEYAEDDTATVYFNYRHYEMLVGRWLSRDPMDEVGGVCLYAYLRNAPNEIDVLGNIPLGELLALSGAITRLVQDNPWVKRAGLAGILLSCADCLLNIYNARQGTPECVKTEFDQGRAFEKCVGAYKNMVGSCLTAALAGVGSAFGPWWGVGGAFAGSVISRLFSAYVPDSVFDGACPRPKIDKCCGEK
jgi:RHS repeat-associated protein